MSCTFIRIRFHGYVRITATILSKLIYLVLREGISCTRGPMIKVFLGFIYGRERYFIGMGFTRP